MSKNSLRFLSFLSLTFFFLIHTSHTQANTPTCQDLLKLYQVEATRSETQLEPLERQKRLTPKDASALELSLALGVDPELSKLVSNPRVAQYIYLNYFAEKVGQNELRVALSDLVKDFEVNHIDLFNLLTKELDEALNDPDVRKKIEVLKSAGSIDRDLRPGKFRAATDRFFSQIKQALNIIPSAKKAYRIVREGMSKPALYEGLFHFYGATQLGLDESKLRTWALTPNGFSDIRPNQIERMSPMAWAMLGYFASETEAPIVNYSTTSGEITRGLNEALSKFLGTTWEEFEAYSEEQQRDFLQGFLQYDSADFCTAVWCKEERRHDPALMYIAQQIWGQVREEDKTYPGAEPTTDYPGAEEALKHLIGRNASEWSANAIYFFLRSHATGPASQWVDQPRIDETKHMAIFAAAYKYFMGNQLLYRTKVMLDSMKVYRDLHKETNSVASEALAEKVSLFELSIVHLFIEYQVRSYLKSIPLKTLAKFFERDPVAMTDRDESDLTEEKRRRIDTSLAAEKHRGQTLDRWTSSEKAREKDLRDFERVNKSLLEALVLDTYFSFRGAETPDSAEDKAFRKEFKRLRFGKGRKFNQMVRQSLENTLTDYQIMNNSWVQSQKNLIAEFTSIETGFEVRHRGPNEVDVIAIERPSPIHTLIRSQKPSGLVFTAGAAFKVTIKDQNGQSHSRILSVSNSPSDSYLEFTTTDSDSSFKQAIVKLNERSSRLYIEKVSEGLDFRPDKPLVLIAGGIGITPFRSLIQERFSNAKNPTDPVTLIYANRVYAAFEDEFLTLSEQSTDFSFHQIRSTETDSWNGPTGRLSPDYLRQTINESLNDQAFYIIGAEGFVNATQTHLLALGVSESQIHTEEFVGNSMTSTIDQSSQSKDSFVIPGESNETGQFLCNCNSVTAEQIQSSIDRGNTTLEAIREDLGVQVSGVCGGCKSKVLDLISSSQ